MACSRAARRKWARGQQRHEPRLLRALHMRCPPFAVLGDREAGELLGSMDRRVMEIPFDQMGDHVLWNLVCVCWGWGVGGGGRADAAAGGVPLSSGSNNPASTTNAFLPPLPFSPLSLLKNLTDVMLCPAGPSLLGVDQTADEQGGGAARERMNGEGGIRMGERGGSSKLGSCSCCRWLHHLW